jgi:hypothetical protein
MSEKRPNFENLKRLQGPPDRLTYIIFENFPLSINKHILLQLLLKRSRSSLLCSIWLNRPPPR